MVKSKVPLRITESIDIIKTKLNQLNSRFESLEMDETNINDIMSQKQSKEVGELIKPVLEMYKHELQGNKEYTLNNTVTVKLEDVFGILSCTDFDTDNIKVIFYSNSLRFR